MKTLLIENIEEIEKIVSQCKVCYAGLSGREGIPYVIPMNFGYERGHVYLHSGPEGKSIELLKENNNICLTFCTGQELVYQDKEMACSYRMRSKSVVAFGKVFFEEDDKEKIRILDIIMGQYSRMKFSYSPAAAANVKIWDVRVSSLTAKHFGVPQETINKMRSHE